MIHAAAEKLFTPVTLIALTVEGKELSGIFIGDHLSAWSAAADLSAQRHIRWSEKPYQRVLSCAPKMYDELWTGAKAMYKLEPAHAAAELHRMVEQEQIDIVALSAHGYSGNRQWPYGSMVNNFILYGKASLLIVQDQPARQEQSSLDGSRLER